MVGGAGNRPPFDSKHLFSQTCTQGEDTDFLPEIVRAWSKAVRISGELAYHL